MIRLPHETSDFLRIPVTVNGAPETGFDVAVVPGQTRPTTWTPATLDDDDHTGVIISGLAAGYYDVYVRIDRDEVDPVRYVESFALD